VVGGGPVGYLAAELARADGWDVTIVETSKMRREVIQTRGHKVVGTLEEVDIRPCVVIDAAGASPVTPWALEHLTPRGVLVVAGYGPLERMDLAPAARKELRIVGIRSGRRDDLIGALASAASGAIRLPSISEWPLREIDAAFAALRSKSVAGKAVIIADSGRRR
jgi:D-arabinose 1-dehydrogenase-like Zn-dependent alcohol dehydrogenase